MFSGIVEAKAQVLSAESVGSELLRLTLSRPQDFNDLRTGDSVATDGICLTVERFDDKTMVFALGAETLRVTGWTRESLLGREVNLERSLKFGDRIHGHLVSGHVDAVGTVVSYRDLGGSVELGVKAPKDLLRFVWKKGSWAINGVSLTINGVQDSVVSHCLIPETLSRTNLGSLRVGERVNLEVDMWARGLANFFANKGGALEAEHNP